MRNVIGCDRHGAIHLGRDGLTTVKQRYAETTNPEGVTGSADEALAGADVFIGALAARCRERDGVALDGGRRDRVRDGEPDAGDRARGDRRARRGDRDRALGLPEPDQQRARLPGDLPRRARRARRDDHRADGGRGGPRDRGRRPAARARRTTSCPSVFNRDVVPAVAAAVAAAAEEDGVARRVARARARRPRTPRDDLSMAATDEPDRVRHRDQAGLHRRRRAAAARAAGRVSVHARPVPRTCTAAGRGRSASTRASRRRRSRTRAIAICSTQGRRGSRSPSTCRRSSATTPTTRARSARSGAPASRSTRSPTWRSLLDGIPLGEVSTSMTINAPASLLLAALRARRRGAGRRARPSCAARSRTTSSRSTSRAATTSSRRGRRCG